MAVGDAAVRRRRYVLGTPSRLLEVGIWEWSLEAMSATWQGRHATRAAPAVMPVYRKASQPGSSAPDRPLQSLSVSAAQLAAVSQGAPRRHTLTTDTFGFVLA